MNIIKNTTVRNRFHKGFARTLPVQIFVAHGTAGGSSAQSVVDWVANMDMSNSFRTSRYRAYKKGIALFNYGIGQGGTIIEIIDRYRWVYHASVGKIDAGTIGVEFVNYSNDNSGPYTDIQYKNGAKLYSELREESFPKMDQFAGHGRMKQKFNKPPGWKNCPGFGFNWSHMRDALSDEGWDFKYQEPYESIWQITKKKPKFLGWLWSSK